MTPKELCQIQHVQMCHICDDYSCCDNTNKEGIGMILYETTISDFDVVPKLRLPLKMRWSKQGQRYLKQKEALAILLKCDFKYDKPITCFVSISCDIYLRHKKRVDIDNLLGFCLDSLQYAGIIEDDRQVREIVRCRLFQGGEMGLRICVRKYDL